MHAGYHRWPEALHMSPWLTDSASGAVLQQAGRSLTPPATPTWADSCGLCWPMNAPKTLNSRHLIA